MIVDYSDQPVERWHFNITTTSAEVNDVVSLQATMRQIGASISYLPILTGRHSFHIVIEDDPMIGVPDEMWSEVQTRRDINEEGRQTIQFDGMVAGGRMKVAPEVVYRVDPRRF